jgi:hypothetical protein
MLLLLLWPLEDEALRVKQKLILFCQPGDHEGDLACAPANP